jgi:UDP-N-acetylglucosamine acyltransferase
MSENIHPTAVVAPSAKIGADVEIGAYCVVGPDVTLMDGVKLHNHASIDGLTVLGAGTEVWPFAAVGGKTQDLKYRGGKPGLKVGENTVIREFATLSCATADGDWTTVGDKCLLMAYTHVAHDCQVGNRVIMSNCATLAGHVIVEDDAIVGGMSGAHQFCRIGRMAMVGGLTKVAKDIPPYMIAEGTPAKVYGPNRVGLERHGMGPEARDALRKAYKFVYRTTDTLAKALEKIEAELPQLPEIVHFVEFIRASERGIVR